ncbi:hypothetical protein LOK49_LG03G02598 [Camellia lanceoleosa]|uniref:Uncharacterized protein n=1 Tax=Camellia lanceoleosa TaxID=1840588 RepID=A0ACC0IE34_9ERIC|nr:hypothetical protein LOK49_LG03G02598 [Camellia lanceoleosa]
MMLGQHVDAFYVHGDYTAFLRSHIIPPSTEGMAHVVRVGDAPAIGDAPVGVASAVKGPAPLAGDYLEMGYMDQCLEVIDTMMVMVWRREPALVSAGIEIAPSLSMRKKGGQALARGREGQCRYDRGRRER